MFYTMTFIFHKNNVLLINRNNSPAKGQWCGIGGLVEKSDVDYFESAKREILEEAKYECHNLSFVGQSNQIRSAIFCCVSQTKFPVEEFNEGVLSWKSIDWALDKANKGVNEITKECLSKALSKFARRNA